MADSDRVIADAEALLQRVSPEGRRLAQRARRRRNAARLRTLRRALLAAAAIVAAAIIWGIVIGPIGQMGVLAALAGMIVAWVVIALASHTPEDTPETLVQSDLAQLPLRTEQWLQRQRPALPAPAVRLIEGIGARLETLGPQLQLLDPREPAAAEIRKLLSRELPELIEGYARVPIALRKETRDGIAPDSQLIEGLAVVDQELGRMSAGLASGDLRKLATQGRYLELKYKDDPAGGGI